MLGTSRLLCYRKKRVHHQGTCWGLDTSESFRGDTLKKFHFYAEGIEDEAIGCRYCGEFLFISHVVALSVYGFIILLTVSPLHYEPGTVAYLAHGITLTLSVYISLFVSIISIHLAVNGIVRRGISGVLRNSSIFTLACMVVLIIGTLYNPFNG
jgi:hypothetical protein